MISKLEIARRKMEIARISNGKLEQELKIMEYEEQIQRLVDSILISSNKIEELELSLEEALKDV